MASIRFSAAATSWDGLGWVNAFRVLVAPGGLRDCRLLKPRRVALVVVLMLTSFGRADVMLLFFSSGMVGKEL